jgi:hypothetical protein
MLQGDPGKARPTGTAIRADTAAEAAERAECSASEEASTVGSRGRPTGLAEGQRVAVDVAEGQQGPEAVSSRLKTPSAFAFDLVGHAHLGVRYGEKG